MITPTSEVSSWRGLPFLLVENDSAYSCITHDSLVVRLPVSACQEINAMNTNMTVGQRRRKRHRDNPNLRLWYHSTFYDFPVQTAHGPLIANYLDTTHRVMTQALQAHSRILAVPLTLRYPKAMSSDQLSPHNTAMSDFLNFLDWELGLINLTHSADMRHIWGREQDTSDKPHYHVWLFFNGNALDSIGALDTFSKDSDEAYSGDWLYHRIVRAWAWATRWPLEQMPGLVEVPKDRDTRHPYVYHFHRDDHNAFQQVFYAASYLCKAYSKPIGQGVHCFEGSRR